MQQQSSLVTCSKLLTKINSTKYAIEENFPDLARLCERCEVFQPMFEDASVEGGEVDEAVEATLTELTRSFKSILNFINDHTDREEYCGITDYSHRLAYIADLTKLSHTITRLSEQLNIVIDADGEKRRREDFEDAKQSFSCAIVLVLDEASSPEHVSKVEKTCNTLLKDIQHYEEVMQKALSSFKHHPLTIVESRGLKSEIKRLSTMVSERRDEILLESLRNVPINYSRSGDAEEEEEEEEQPVSRDYDADPLDLDNSDSSESGPLTAHAVTRLLTETMTSEDQRKRSKALEEMRLSSSDVVMSGVQIGKGGFGEVFLGSFKGRYRIAIKTVRRPQSANTAGKVNGPTGNTAIDTALKSIENELLLMKYLGNYPTILTCYGFISDDASFSVVLELAAYGSLDVILRDNRNYPALPLSLVIAWLCDLADALKFIHSKEIKHRDIKAENLLVFERFRVKLCDFGPAKQHMTHADTMESRVGTFSFMAPEIRVGGSSEFASDIFSFAMTAVQMLTRKTPKIDDFKGQILACLFAANIPLSDVNEMLSSLLSSCVSYDSNKNQNEIRPSAAIVSNDMNIILEKLGGDPRDNVDMFDVMNELEIVARRLEAERLMGKNNAPAQTPATPLSPNSLDNEAARRMASYSSFIRVPSSTDIQSPGFERMPTGMSPPPLTHSTSSIMLAFDPTQQDAEDKALLTQFFVDQFRYNSANASNYADMLVRNGVSSVDALRRRCNRNRDYLINIGFEERVSKEVLQVLLNAQSTGKFLGLKGISASSSGSFFGQQALMSPLNNSTSFFGNNTSFRDLGETSVHSGETSSQHSSNNDQHGGVGGGAASQADFYPLSIQHSQDMEDRAALIRFFSSNIHVDHIVAMRSADMLMRNGVPTIEVLARRLLRDPEFLLNIGFEDSLAQDISDHFAALGSSPNAMATSSYTMRRLSSNLSSTSLNNSSSVSPAGHRSLRRSSTTISMILRSDHLPTEISRLYYDATQCNNRDALLKLMHIADNGENLAQGFVMRMYALGQGGLQKDLLAAQELGNHLLPWLRSAIESSNDLTSMYARYLIGVCYSEGLGTKKDIREALRWYRMSAEQGYSAAQAYMAFAYYSGMGMVQNLQEAVRWYTMSADQGYAAAQCNLGLCYEHGYGTTKNPELAVKWYKAGAEQGDAASLYNLGHCLEHGLGIAVSLENAFSYYLRSAELGYTSAQYKVGYCYYTGEGVQQNLDCAVAWFRASAMKGFAAAQCKLGLCYENGHGVEKSPEKAAEMYRLSADQGHPPALYYLGYLSYSGSGVPRNVEEAVRLYKMAAEKGYAPAQNNLGFCYFNGIGMPKNLTAAVQWYKKAAEQDYAAAQYNLGYCYEKGYGVAMKLHELLKWYRLAAANGNEKAKQALMRYDITN
eukprot:gene10136-11021_t